MSAKEKCIYPNSLKNYSMDKVQTMEIVSVNFSHILFSLMSTHDDLVWFGMFGFCVSCKFKTT